MKNTMLFASVFMTMVLVSCIPVTTATPSIIPPTPTNMPNPTATISILPSQTPYRQGGMVIKPYLDVRFQNISNSDRNLDESLIQTLRFNESTTWSKQDKQVAQNVLQLGMNPGLGIRALHAEGITGKGVNIAIIDQNLLLDHPEFSGKIVKYYDVGTDQPDDKGSMHGPAVTSLLVGQNIGTAPGVKIYYVAAPSWLLDAKYYAEALNWIIEENEKLPDDQKIRAVSVSAAPSGEGSPFTKNNDDWDAAYQRAMDAGILVIDCTLEHRITAPCYYDLHDPDNLAKCIPGWPQIENYRPYKDLMHVPIPRRTIAEEYDKGKFSYQYDGQGGLSWSPPYLAGVLAMGWQVNPNLTSSQLLDLLYSSAYVTDANIKIIDPKAFIDMVSLTINE